MNNAELRKHEVSRRTGNIAISDGATTDYYLVPSPDDETQAELVARVLGAYWEGYDIRDVDEAGEVRVEVRIFDNGEVVYSEGAVREHDARGRWLDQPPARANITLSPFEVLAVSEAAGKTLVRLDAALDAVTAEQLGPEADAHDVAAYREALKRAWGDPTAALPVDSFDALAQDVREGRAGRCPLGRDWVQVAAARRT